VREREREKLGLKIGKAVRDKFYISESQFLKERESELGQNQVHYYLCVLSLCCGLCVVHLGQIYP
jgi:hypothetical protein